MDAAVNKVHDLNNKKPTTVVSEEERINTQTQMAIAFAALEKAQEEATEALV
jgi:hypothetical protein